MIGSSTALKVTESRMEWNENGTYPTTFPNLNPNIAKIKLPPWIVNSNQPEEVFGSITILEDFETSHLHSGDIDDFQNRMNLLCLSDGFNSTTGANRSTFCKVVQLYQNNNSRLITIYRQKQKL